METFYFQLNDPASEDLENTCRREYDNALTKQGVFLMIRKYRMAKVILHKRKYALIYRDDALLFIRLPGEKAFRLPSVEGNKKALRLFLAEHLGVNEAVVVRALPESIFYGAGWSELQSGFVIQADVASSGDIEARFVEEGDLPLLEVDEASKGLATRGYIYAPLNQGKPRTVPLLPQDDEKAYWMVECVKYFRKKIPSAEREEFIALVYSASSMRRINAAFVALCNLYKANPEQYNRYLEYLEKRRKAYR